VGTDKRNRQKQNRAAAREALARRQRRDKVKGRALKWGGLAGLLLVIVIAISVTGGDDSSQVEDTLPAEDSVPALTTVPGEAITGDTPCPAAEGTIKRATSFEKEPPMCIDAAKKYVATFDTTEGEIVVDLDTEKTPNTVNNFVVLSRYGYYDGSYVFRTDPGIEIIQGGGASNTDDPGYSIKDEGTGFKYTEGDLVMARTSAPDSAGGQWFFVAGPKASLLDSQGNYVTFGKVSEGLDVVKGILALNSGGGDLGGVPSRTVEIRSVTITES
jgi:cyclophilin family peptidyl-prolyl cis-trans isomerase